MKADKPTKLKSKRLTLGGVPYSTERVRRKRQEAQALRLEAETLTTQLSGLQATHLHNGAADSACQYQSTTSPTQWRNTAVVE
ncbi:hypothetical protein PR003_g11879 [Phytophthora rubi]|uniref:Uncharacterized protein n=1 Tax=Phytophthora rubi TaxID=129364 RepID=A0A6A3MZQ7_9STRA|nr:hypothetical protein PR002_g7966 [Phytophthora rubi]KAE9039093.1 hypothetical protein PR001_g7665 [Phytophthora rubi]KAE9337708.1 hypothetical protein PR003_g11879 [Phytophthora rubi]